jgi:hypothetical protein
MNNRKIIFVYDAKNNLFNMLTDYVHKAVSPSTYQCNLCKLTHNNFGMKKEWKEIINKINYKKSFLYKEDFVKAYPDHPALTAPAVYVEEKGKLQELVTATELNSYQSLDELWQGLSTKLNKL